MTEPLAPSVLTGVVAVATLATALVWVELALGAARSRFTGRSALVVGLVAALVPVLGHVVALRFLWTHRHSRA